MAMTERGNGTRTLVAVTALLVGPARAWAQDAAQQGAGGAATVDVNVAAGLQLTDVSGSREKFEEYGSANDGLVLDALRLRLPGANAADYVEVDARASGEDDQFYQVTVGRQGRYRLEVGYDALPHRFASGTSLWGGVGTGRLQVADVVQSQLEANEQTASERGPPATDPVTDTTGEDAIQQGIVRGLYAAANRVSFGLDRRRVGAALEVNVSRDASAWVRVRNENRTGTRALGTGSYERWAAGSGLEHTADRFIVLGAELAEPRDYRTLGVDAGAGIHGRAWLADVEYSFTRFRNFEDVLLWDNPFRITDAAQAAGFDRSRFAVGQLVLPPDSNSHELSATGAVDIPLHGRLAASASYGLITQDDAFFPYTRNSAIVATDLAGTAVGPASTAALPARDLDGDVRTIAGTLTATVRPANPLALSAKYRVYRYDGRSAEITFPGYAAFGESGWRREKNDVSPELDAPVRNEVFDYWRHDADLGADVRLSRILSVSAEVAAEAWRFGNLRLDKLDEYAAGAGFTVKPAQNASLKVAYRYSDRESDGYQQGATPENPEARGLLNYNWSDRKRHLADARVQYAPSRVVTFGVLGRFLDDEYGGETEGGTPIDRFRFGRTDARTWLGSLDVGVTPVERLSLQLTYTLESRLEELSAATKDDGPKAVDDFGFPDNFAPENYWDSEIDETVHSIGAAATVQIVPERLELDVGYDVSLSDMDVDTSNPNGVSGTTLANAVANDWPTIENRLHSVYGNVSYAFSRAVRAGVRYLYESYDVDDFAWDIVDPYMAGRSVENSTRYVFADALYGGYEAHVATAYVNGSF
jgi:MtrB/PioB family decaheme-associated outer membrane protein